MVLPVGGGRYEPIRASPHPPFDVAGPLAAVFVAASAVVVWIVRYRVGTGAAVVAIAALLAALVGRRWRRKVRSDPDADLTGVLFAPMWGANVVVLAALLVAARIEGQKVSWDDFAYGLPLGAVLLAAGGAVASVWFAAAAASGGPWPPGTRARAAMSARPWRSAASMLWPLNFFGVLGVRAAGPRGFVTCVPTVSAELAWIAIAAVTALHAVARVRAASPHASAPPPAPPAASERGYREPSPPVPDPPPPAPDEPDVRPALRREIVRDAAALAAASVVLAMHAWTLLG